MVVICEDRERKQLGVAPAQCARDDVEHIIADRRFIKIVLFAMRSRGNVKSRAR
jgi:hypothetical protein